MDSFHKLGPDANKMKKQKINYTLQKSVEDKVPNVTDD